MLTVVTFKWNAEYRHRYTALHANVLEAMVRRHCREDLRFITVTDDPEGISGETHPLWTDCSNLKNACGDWLPSCYRRLKLFDPATQAGMGIQRGSRIVSLDLDTVIMDDVTSLWQREERFVGWALPGTHHARVFNGSMWLLRAGECADVWRDFDPDRSPAEAKAAGYLGSDQAWMSFRLQGEAGWGEADGVISFPRALQERFTPPHGSRIVMFHGRTKPWDCVDRAEPAWVAEHWHLDREGRCLILGYDAATLWSEAEAALRSGPFDGVIASPEASAHLGIPVLAVAENDVHAERLARIHGFKDFVFCGRTEDRKNVA